MKTLIALYIAYIILCIATAAAVMFMIFYVTQQSFASVQPHVAPQIETTYVESTALYNQMAELINVKRAENGQSFLTINQELNQSAQLKANDMIAKDYWSHDDLTGASTWHFFGEGGYSYKKAGENLAKCYNTAESAVNAWWNSPTHKANMLGQFNDVGFGTGTDKDGCLVIVNHFGSKA